MRALRWTTWLVALLGVTSIGCETPEATVRGTAQPGEPCAETNECVIGFSCIDERCGHTEPYRITLSWTVDTDFDLHVIPPNGQELYFSTLNSQAYLTVDDCFGGKQSALGQSCSEGTHREHAILRELTASDAGMLEYEYWVDNYGCDTAGDFTLEVVAADHTVLNTHMGSLPAACAESPHIVFTPTQP